MRFSTAILLATALLMPGSASGEPTDDAIVGVWRTEEGEKGGRAHVEISHQDSGLVGRIVHLEEPEFPAGHERAGEPKVDLENPDPSLRQRPILGLLILEGFEHQGGSRWTGGTVYDPANGKTYRAQITLADEDRLELRGYVGIPLFGRTTTWQRVR